MEHVLHDDCGSMSDDEKVAYADDFADMYEDKPEEFLELLSSSSFTVAGDYGETWRFIFSDTNSLHRHSNLHILFEENE